MKFTRFFECVYKNSQEMNVRSLKETLKFSTQQRVAGQLLMADFEPSNFVPN
jgi:hypothetical protein